MEDIELEVYRSYRRACRRDDDITPDRALVLTEIAYRHKQTLALDRLTDNLGAGLRKIGEGVESPIRVKVS